MGFWKVLGCAAVGLGAFAAAPLTGGGSVLAGVSLLTSIAGTGAAAAAIGTGAVAAATVVSTGTVAAAAAAGAAGAVAGVALSGRDKKEKERELRRAREEGMAAGEKIAEDKWQAKLKALCARLNEYENFAQKLVGLFAVGLAVANADGIISEEEKAELDALVSGISASALPDDVKEAIKNMRAVPPNFDQAMSIARKYGCSAEDVDVVIEVMANADDVVTPEEEAFIARWNSELRPRMVQ